MSNENYLFEISTMRVLELSRNISEYANLDFIPKTIFSASLFISRSSPMYRYLLNKYITKNKIAGVPEDYILETSENEIAEKALNYICKVLHKPNELATLHCENSMSYTLDSSIFTIFDKAVKISSKLYGKKTIAITDLIAAFSETFYDDYMDIMLTFDSSFNLLPASSNCKFNNSTPFTIPDNLSSFLTVLNNNFSPDENECYICGRDEETKLLIRILMKTTKRNAILVGEPGVGKTALVEKFTWMIVTGNCPEFFKDCIVLSLDVNAIVAGTMYRGTAEQRFMDLISFLENHPECILFIDEIHLLLGAGACKDGDLDLANALKPILARGKTRVIGATTSDEYKRYFSKDGALKRRFEKIIVNEPRTFEVYPMIQNQIKKLEASHGTTISKDLVDFVILNASCYNFETRNPDRTLDLLDKCMVCAQIENRHAVTKKDVLDNFSINKRKFDKLTYKIKKSTAYHEAGHYIVHRFSDELSEYVVLAVSIIPSDYYLGINVLEIDPDITSSKSRNYYIQRLGSLLAGRIAEKMYSNELTAGASSDLEKATRIAKDIITRYGLDEAFTQDRVYLRESDNPMYNDELISVINKHVDKILEEARKYVENLLSEKRDYLTLLVDCLMKDGILSASEIDKIFQTYENCNTKQHK
jgi:ATP-dependent Clp protease ATP-binding subunit ClpA